MRSRFTLLAAAAVLLVAATAAGQVTQPPSGGNQRASITQYLGLVKVTVDYNSPNMQVTQWNLSLQRQIGLDWLASASYLGNHTIHFWSTQPINPAVFIPGGPCTLNGVVYNPCSQTGNTDQRRRLALENSKYGQYYGGIVRIDTGGTSSYNGLLLSLQRRAARGITVSANYTWSHCITDTQDEFGALNATSGYSNPDDRHFSRGNCTVAGTDRRQIFNAGEPLASEQNGSHGHAAPRADASSSAAFP